MEKLVGAALLVNKGRLLIAQRPINDHLAGYWEFPGGKVENGEAIEECIRRELKEEFGIDICVTEFFADSLYRYERGLIKLVAFWAEWIAGEMHPTFHSAYKWVLPEELSAYVFAPADVPLVEPTSPRFE